jgi:hypothetical protein
MRPAQCQLRTHLIRTLFCRYSCCRLAVLTNLKDQLDSMGIPLLCVAHSDSSVDSATEPASAQRLHPTAELWRALCCTAANATARLAADGSTNKSSHNSYGVDTQPYRNSQPQKGSQCILVTDACDLPKHRLIVRQLGALENAPLVVCVDSIKPFSKGAAQVRCKSAQFPILCCVGYVTQLSVLIV